jgi:hypothetical protein
MQLIGYKASFFNTNLDEHKKVFLSRFLKDTFKNTCRVFNNVLQNQVFAKSLRLWQTILNILSLQGNLLIV